MALNIVEKIVKSHLGNEGDICTGNEVALRIDQTLTQDSTGTMAYLQLEAMGVTRVKTKRSVAYIDHNTLQTGFENADDHKYIQTVAAKYGINFSKPGNGICHQVNLERFAIPGSTLLGSDSHTPTAGGMGMLAIGAGGLDVAVAMAGGPYYLNMPKVVKVELTGKLPSWVSAKDVILYLLKQLGVKGGVGKVFEYGGDGVQSLSVPERSTITNMGAELGATTSIFPSDEETLKFLKAQGREAEWAPLEADENANYHEIITINLSELQPLVAQPHSPDAVIPVIEIKNLKVDQVAIGSCTNSSYTDLMKVAAILRGKRVHSEVSLVISPGSKQVLQMLADNGALGDLISAGARILECTCGPCIGMGQAPASNAVSVRTFNRNFEGRSGTKSAEVYLASPEVAAATAVTGFLTDPRSLGEIVDIDYPENFTIDDSMIISPLDDTSKVEVVRGPNIKPVPTAKPLPKGLEGKVLLIVGDNITTDHIMPSNAKLLPFRSNIPKLAEYCLTPVDENFPKRAIDNEGGFIIGGENYGQGSSREHAALAPLYLGIKGVIVKSFARIHKSNLINFGILPLTFERLEDIDKVAENDILSAKDVHSLVMEGKGSLFNETSGVAIPVILDITPRQKEILLAGGLLNFTTQGK
ncbi:MAG: aconitate hydratase [Desulfitibacter sp. BRH_c19]|nr:MAG: aconitate hydratase [Desulfitibacter sp. BRH_c19]